jgi:hypothetical protein
MLCAALGMCDLTVEDDAQLLFSCPVTTVIGWQRRLAQHSFTSFQDLMCCLRVALFVHKCMKFANAAATAASMQQPR